MVVLVSGFAVASRVAVRAGAPRAGRQLWVYQHSVLVGIGILCTCGVTGQDFFQVTSVALQTWNGENE